MGCGEEAALERLGVSRRDASFPDAGCAALMHAENEWTAGVSPLENAVQWKAMLDAGVFKNQSMLADEIGCHRGTVSRAIRNATVLFDDAWLARLVYPVMHKFSGRVPSGPVATRIERESDGGWLVRVPPHEQTPAQRAELAEHVETLLDQETAPAAGVRLGRRLTAILAPDDAVEGILLSMHNKTVQRRGRDRQAAGTRSPAPVQSALSAHEQPSGPRALAATLPAVDHAKAAAVATTETAAGIRPGTSQKILNNLLILIS